MLCVSLLTAFVTLSWSMKSPVSGLDTDEKFYLDFNYGGRIYFHDLEEIVTFIKDPLRYVVEDEEDEVDLDAVPASGDAACVITGEAIDFNDEESPWIPVIFEHGQALFFCCPMCSERFLLNPLASLLQPEGVKPYDQFMEEQAELEDIIEDQEKEQEEVRKKGARRTRALRIVAFICVLAIAFGIWYGCKRRKEKEAYALQQPKGPTLLKVFREDDEGSDLEANVDDPLDGDDQYAPPGAANGHRKKKGGAPSNMGGRDLFEGMSTQ
eukprot:gb/GEZN01013397.1/.p1 GENE.gb/GEZN01013397.1/~~gb/GEZN01013397.1/.p1  ORF type:complete len:268 (-),score=53.30 gb/GEZN01013397.1/:153-956(-)